MSTVAKVSPWEKDGKTRYYVTLSDGTEAVSFSGDAANLEIGKPLPDGWVIEPPKEAGWKPMLKAPKKSGGGFGGQSAWRNTKEGAWFEAVARAVNTAVMQSDGNLEKADKILTWSLKKLNDNRPAPVAPPQTHLGGGSPAKPSPGASGAEREKSGHKSAGTDIRGVAKVDDKAPASRASDDDNPWAGMKEFS